jgi:hypothetical protein
VSALLTGADEGNPDLMIPVSLINSGYEAPIEGEAAFT